jgi:mono/diheme cytochrome c family protein
VCQWLAVVATTLTLFEAGTPMPAFMLKAEDADAISAYLKSLP